MWVAWLSRWLGFQSSEFNASSTSLSIAVSLSGSGAPPEAAGYDTHLSHKNKKLTLPVYDSDSDEE